MKIGILADIHGHVENLRIAIELLRRERVDQDTNRLIPINF